MRFEVIVDVNEKVRLVEQFLEDRRIIEQGLERAAIVRRKHAGKG